MSQRQEVMATSLKDLILGIWPLLLNTKKIWLAERPLAPPGPFTSSSIFMRIGKQIWIFYY